MAEAKPTANQTALRAGELAAAEANLTRNLNTLQDEVDRYLNNIANLTVLRFGISLDPVAVSESKRAEMRKEFADKLFGGPEGSSVVANYIIPDPDGTAFHVEKQEVIRGLPNLTTSRQSMVADVQNPLNYVSGGVQYYNFPEFMKVSIPSKPDEALIVAKDLVSQFKEFVNESVVSETKIDLKHTDFDNEAQKRIKINRDPYTDAINSIYGLRIPVESSLIKRAGIGAQLGRLPGEVVRLLDTKIPGLPDNATLQSLEKSGITDSNVYAPGIDRTSIYSTGNQRAIIGEIFDLFLKNVVSTDHGPNSDAITTNDRKEVYKILQELATGLVADADPELQGVIEESFSNVYERIDTDAATAEKPVAIKDLEDNWRFDPQAYLYYQISTVSSQRLLQPFQGNRSHFKNIRLAEVRPSIVNNLFAAANEKKMLDLTTVQASHILPKVKIFSVKRFKNGKVKESQIKFDTHLTRKDISNIFDGKRGGGVGLQEVQINFQGTDLVSVDRLFSVDLTLFIQDAEKITKSNLDTHFLRLIEYKVKSEKKSHDEELRLEIGWSVDDSSGNLFTRAMRREVESNKISLLMGLKDHTFTVNPDGTLNLKVEYVGRLENLFSSRDADIFPVEDSKSLADLYRQKVEVESENFIESFKKGFEEVVEEGVDISPEDLGAQASSAQVAERKKKITQINNQRKEILRSRYESIMDTLLNRGLIYQTYVSSVAQERFRDYCQLSVLENGSKPVIRTNDNVVITQSDSMPSPNPGYHLINFFYFGDFLDVAIDAMHDTKTNTNQPSVQKNKKYEFMLGMVPTVSPGVQGAGAEKKTLHNLALMPITVSTYMEWFKKNVDEKGRINYAFFDFIKDVCNDLIFKVLGGNYFSQTERMKPPVSKLSINNFALNDESKVFKKFNRIVTEQDLKKGKMFPSDHSTGNLREVFFIYALPTLGSVGYMSGKKKEDAANGIYHLSVGRDKGVLKEVNFAKANIQGWRESQTLKSVENKDNVFATAPYNCDIKMIGNTMFKPGMTIFVDPLISGFGSVANSNSIARKLEIGGYYTILGASHYVRGTMFETSLRCVYNSVPNDPTARDNKEEMVTIRAVASRQISQVASQASEAAGVVKDVASDALDSAKAGVTNMIDSIIPGGN